MAAPVIQLKDIALTFGGTPLLNGVELTVSEGERVCHHVLVHPPDYADPVVGTDACQGTAEGGPGGLSHARRSPGA